MDLDAVNLAGSIVSVVVGCLAIALAIVFYVMSTKASSQIAASATTIEKAIGRLEQLVGTLYADAFRALRESHAGMLRHVLGETSPTADELAAEMDRRMEEKVDAIRVDIGQQVEAVVTKDGRKRDAEMGELRRLLDQAVAQSARAGKEAREEVLGDHLDLVAAGLVGLLADRGITVDVQLTPLDGEKVECRVLYPGGRWRATFSAGLLEEQSISGLANVVASEIRAAQAREREIVSRAEREVASRAGHDVVAGRSASPEQRRNR